MANINKLIRADPSFPSWLFALFCLPNISNNNKNFFRRQRNNFTHDVCLCFGRMNKNPKITKYIFRSLCCLVQTTLTLGGTGDEAGSVWVSVTSQNLPHFQFFSIKGVSLPPLPSLWLCSRAAISQVTDCVRDSHPSAFTSQPFPSYKSPPPLRLSLSQPHWV